MYAREGQDRPKIVGFDLFSLAVEEVVEVWPENYAAFQLFCDLQTQWRVSMNGYSGLDYNVLFKLLDRMRLSDEEYDLLFEDVQYMEREALAAIHEKQD